MKQKGAAMPYNEVIKTILERRSIRKFKSELPKKEDIDAIIEAGLYAPSGMNRQGTVILAVTDKAVRDKLSDDNRAIGGWSEGFDPFYGAPAILIVLANKAVPTAIYDGSLVMENLMLAAQSLGLGSIWIHRARRNSRPTPTRPFSGSWASRANGRASATAPSATYRASARKQSPETKAGSIISDQIIY